MSIVIDLQLRQKIRLMVIREPLKMRVKVGILACKHILCQMEENIT